MSNVINDIIPRSKIRAIDTYPEQIITETDRNTIARAIGRILEKDAVSTNQK